MVNLVAIHSRVPIDWPANLIFNAATIMLALSIAYLCYALAHTITDALMKRDAPVWRQIRALCHAIMLAVLYVIAALHLLEYVSLSFIETA